MLLKIHIMISRTKKKHRGTSTQTIQYPSIGGGVVQSDFKGVFRFHATTLRRWLNPSGDVLHQKRENTKILLMEETLQPFIGSLCKYLLRFENEHPKWLGMGFSESTTVPVLSELRLCQKDQIFLGIFPWLSTKLNVSVKPQGPKRTMTPQRCQEERNRWSSFSFSCKTLLFFEKNIWLLHAFKIYY